ncbi:unnamed protein product, partial [Closterium sp. NIES-54]
AEAPDAFDCDGAEAAREHRRIQQQQQPQPQQQQHQRRQQWQGVLARMQAGPPRCAGHGEACVVRVVKRPGANKGRGFYVCARAKGPSDNPQARCNHFKWVARPTPPRRLTAASASVSSSPTQSSAIPLGHTPQKRLRLVP